MRAFATTGIEPPFAEILGDVKIRQCLGRMITYEVLKEERLQWNWLRNLAHSSVVVVAA
jgi:hypothetical protein